VTAKGSSIFTLTNTNKLLRAVNGCDGLKTGSTSQAKYCLSATAQRDGIRLIAAVMTAPESKVRFAEAGQLLNYGFTQCTLYRDETPQSLPQVEVKGSVEKQADVSYAEEFTYLSTTGEDFSAIESHIEWNDSITAPLTAGTQVGTCIYTLDTKEIGRVPIILTQDIHKAGYTDYLNELSTYFYI
jgi:D-alanyl-D-alanine carboxypeptidase (penicillin-binding protein 5/6)